MKAKIRESIQNAPPYQIHGNRLRAERRIARSRKQAQALARRRAYYRQSPDLAWAKAILRARKGTSR